MKKEGILQFMKFGVVGLSNTAVDWIVYYLLTNFVMTATSSEPTAKAISFIVAVINSYLWNTIWTFKKEYGKVMSKAKKGAGTLLFIKFFSVSLVGWGINYFTFKYTRFNMNQSQLIALVAASASSIIWNFFGNKLWTYKK